MGNIFRTSCTCSSQSRQSAFWQLDTRVVGQNRRARTGAKTAVKMPKPAQSWAKLTENFVKMTSAIISLYWFFPGLIYTGCLGILGYCPRIWLILPQLPHRHWAIGRSENGQPIRLFRTLAASDLTVWLCWIEKITFFPEHPVTTFAEPGFRHSRDGVIHALGAHAEVRGMPVVGIHVVVKDFKGKSLSIK